MPKQFSKFALCLGLSANACTGVTRPAATITDIGHAATPGVIEIMGVRAAEFNPVYWTANTLHFLPDHRIPLLAPREGKFQNIYAPSAVRAREGWTIYYGAWDGSATGNDRIYATTTTDFLSFGPRQTIIEHGPFRHVCNVNALTDDADQTYLTCTAYPDQNNWNKPAIFNLKNPIPEEPVVAGPRDLVKMAGYDNYSGADINGMSVLFREGDQYRLYFCDFRQWGKVFQATSSDPMTTFTSQGVALDSGLAVNDVKKFRASGQKPHYLMGLHFNRNALYYALSTDSAKFTTTHTLFNNLSDADRHIVALGWVTDGGDYTQGSERLLGVLYGAGAKPSLDANRIFARWLQKRIVMTALDGNRLEPERAFGPDGQVMQPTSNEISGHLNVYAEDGITKIAVTGQAHLKKGRRYRLNIPANY